MRQVCTNCHSRLPPEARFCMQCGEPLRARSAADEARHVRLRAAAPAPLIEKARQFPILSGEQRTVTILYADVVGSATLAAQVGARRWEALLADLFDRLGTCVYRFEGTIARLLDDSLWAFFGLPIAHEDDPTRAVRAALDMVETAESLSRQFEASDAIRLRIRTCIHHGAIVVNAVGHDLAVDFTTPGGAVNVATRMKFAAEPMTTLVSQQVQRFVAPLFETHQRERIEMPGQPGAIGVYQIQGLRARPDETPDLAGLHSPMVGRDQELSTLLSLAQTVRAGLGRVVVVIGEPGVGKTRLVAEWRASLDSAHTSADGFRWIVGSARSSGQRMAYRLLRSAVQDVLGVPETAAAREQVAAVERLTGDLFEPANAEEAAVYLTHLLSLPLDAVYQSRVERQEPQALRTRYRETLYRLLARLAGRGPLVLVLEDVHWADPSSTALLRDLLPLLAPLPLLLCLVTRPEQEAPGWELVTAARQLLGGSLTELTLRRLGDQDSRALIANLLEIEALPDAVRRLIQAKTEGNPLFVEEVLRMLIERQAIARRDGAWTAVRPIDVLDIPGSLQGLLMARIDRLPDEVRQTLRVAAIFGRQFPLPLLARVLGDVSQSTLLDQLNKLESTGLVQLAPQVPEVGYQFRHALMQDAAYATLLPADRQRLHLAVGEAMEQLYADRLDRYASQLAYHFQQADDRARARHYYLAAGFQALRSYANSEAEMLFRQALSTGGAEVETARVLSGLGEALRLTGQIDDALTVWRQGIDLYRKAGDLDGVAYLFACSARAASHESRWHDALALCAEGMGIVAGAPDSPEQAQLIHETGRAYYFNGMREEARVWCKRALAMARGQDAKAVEIDTLITMGILPDQSLEASRALLRQSAELAESAELLELAWRAWHNLGSIDDLANGSRWLERAVAAARRLGSPGLEVASLVILGTTLIIRANTAKLPQIMARIDTLLTRAGNPAFALIDAVVLHELFLWLNDDVDASLAELRTFLTLVSRLGDLQNWQLAAYRLAIRLMERAQLEQTGDLSEAEHALLDVLAHRKQGFGRIAPLHYVLSRLYARQGRLAEAQRCFDEGFELETENPSQRIIASRWLAQAELALVAGRWRDAFARYEAVVELNNEMGRIWERANAILEWTQALLNRGKPDDLQQALRLLGEATAVYDRMGAARYQRLAAEARARVRAALYDQARERERATAELTAAGRIQASFLPRHLPELSGWELTAVLHPARETSGDFYDVLPLPDGQVALMIADVAGKGAEAAMFMAMCGTALRAAIRSQPTAPELALREANQRILTETHSDMFVTVFLGILNPGSGTLAYANAGHNPPLLVARDGDCRWLTLTGMALGVIPASTWRHETAVLARGMSCFCIQTA